MNLSHLENRQWPCGCLAVQVDTSVLLEMTEEKVG